MNNIKTSYKVILGFIILLIILLSILLIGKFTFSFMAPDLDDNFIQSGEVTASGDMLIFSKGDGLNMVASADNFNLSSGNLSKTTNPFVTLIANRETGHATATYNAGFIITNNTFQYSTKEKNSELILSIYDENMQIINTSDNLKFVQIGDVSGFDITEVVGAFTVETDHKISTNSSSTGTRHTWTYTLTFVNYETDQAINENAEINIEAILQKDNVTLPLISDLCLNQEISQCFTNNYTIDLSLTAHKGDYYNTSGQIIDANDGSYRYSGSYQYTNNYVCFGPDAENYIYGRESTCPTEALYRIIGFFPFTENGVTKYRTKLIKADFATAQQLGKTSNSGSTYKKSDQPTYLGWQEQILRNRWHSLTYNVTWSTSEIHNLLNNNFYGYLGTDWNSKIAKSTWYNGGMGQFNKTASIKEIFDAEFGPNGAGKSVKVENEAIGLMYFSDYVYAYDKNNWNETIDSLELRHKENWLNINLFEWTMTKATDSENHNQIMALGINQLFPAYSSANAYGVRPTFYLNSSVELKKGTGTIKDPYVVE